jgi:predicted transcriptional regulator
VKAFLPHKPEHLLAEQQLQTLEIQLSCLVAGEVFPFLVTRLLLLARDAARLAKVIVLVDVELDVALRFVSTLSLVDYTCYDVDLVRVGWVISGAG